ncbi:MAG: hypothetical protein ACOVQN_04405 [Exiguobacterium sp.]
MADKEFTGAWIARWRKLTELDIHPFCIILCKSSDGAGVVAITLSHPDYSIKNFELAHMNFEYAQKKWKGFLQICGKIMSDCSIEWFHADPKIEDLSFGRYKDLFTIWERINQHFTSRLLWNRIVFTAPERYILPHVSSSLFQKTQRLFFAIEKQTLNFSGEEKE